jgi:DNA-binding GntR family transcriptional regulator
MHESDRRSAMGVEDVDELTPTEPRRVVRSNMSAAVRDRIQELIFDGTLKSGARIPQDAIAEELGVSRLPVREAIIALQAEGLVDSEPHRGSFVVPITQEDIEDHYAMYGAVQGIAAARAATRASEPLVHRLEALLAEMERDPSAPSTTEAHWSFHSAINQAGGSRRLRTVLRQMAHNLPREVYDLAPSASPQSNLEHRQLIEALRSGEGDTAARICEEHLSHEGRIVVVELQARGLLSEQ